MKPIAPWLWPPWTKSAETPQKEPFTKECQDSLVAIILAFQSASECVAEIPAALFLGLKEADAIENVQVHTILLGVDDYIGIHHSRIFKDTTDNEECQLNDRVLDALNDTQDENFIYYWRRALNSLNLAYPGTVNVASRFAKQYALDMLEHRDKAAEHVDLISDELSRKGHDKLLRGILDKIRFLERFKAVYDARADEHQAEPTYSLYPMKTGRNAAKIDSDAQKQVPPGYTSALIAIVSVVTLVTLIPLGFAWKVSTNEPGYTSDADFYLVLQNALMTLLGLFTGVYPTLWRRASIDSRWAHGLAFVGAGCAIMPIPLYLKVPTIWSAVMAFIGQAIQGYLAMQLAMAASDPPKRVKQD